MDSFDSSKGTYAATKQSSAGNIGTNGNIRLDGSAKVNGTGSSPHTGTGNCNPNSLTALTASGEASVSGGIVTLLSPVLYSNPPVPDPTPPATNQNIAGTCGSIPGCTTLSGSKNVALAVGQYGNVSVSAGTTVHLQTGTYNFNNLSLSGNSALVLDSTPVTLNFAGQALGGNDSAVDLTGGSITNSSGKPKDFQILYAGAAAIKLVGGSGSYGVVYAPNAPITMSGGADWYGAVIGYTVSVGGDGDSLRSQPSVDN